MNTVSEFFGDTIHTYTRAQAIADGVLVDVTDTAREAGFRVPVALTRAVWEDCVAWSDEDSERQVYQDQSGRLWDVLWMACMAARGSTRQDRLIYRFFRVPRDGHSRSATETPLKLVVGPGDEGEPVVTIMLPEED